MADFGAERESLLANEAVMAARKKLDEAIHDYGKTLKLNFNSVQGKYGPVMVVDAEALAGVLGNQQAMLMDVKREVLVMGTVAKIMTLFIDEGVVDEVADLVARSIEKHAENIEKTTAAREEKEKKASSKLITSVDSAMANKMNNKLRT